MAVAASDRAAAAAERSAAEAIRTALVNAFCAAGGELPPLDAVLAICTAGPVPAVSPRRRLACGGGLRWQRRHARTLESPVWFSQKKERCADTSTQKQICPDSDRTSAVFQNQQCR